MKTCNRCGEEKDLSGYYKRKASKDGHYHTCKSCAKAQTAKQREADPDKNRADLKKWYKKNASYAKEKARLWHHNNKEKRAAYVRANASAAAARTAKRRAIFKHGCSQMPDSERAEVEYLYWLARDLTAVSGEQYHVDHIKPLSKGGEHRLDNLQILHAEDNLKKGAKHDQSA
jgi:5-methylcytosine-specific restriction endonuclease McrA